MEKVSNIIPYYIKQLNGVVQEREIISLAYISIDFLLGYSRSDCIIHSDKDITSEVSGKIKEIIADLKTNKPIQHIIGETEFYGLKFKVNEHTLIPRPETEELVQWILEHEFTSALDIGTGSGCIPIALKKNKDAEITAIDVSESALWVAKENAKINEVEINFLLQDILKTTTLPKIDVIISNPPYIDEKSSYLNNPELSYEPKIALISKNKGLKDISHIIEESPNFLSKKGRVFIEHGFDQSGEINSIFLNNNFTKITQHKDLNKIIRVSSGEIKN